MKIGYLHLNLSTLTESGVTRYGRILASEARKKEGVVVTEVTINLKQKVLSDFQIINQAIKKLSDTDCLYLSYSRYAWGGLGQLYYIVLIFLWYHQPIIVNLHDVYEYLYSSKILANNSNFKTRLNNLSLNLIFKKAKYIVVNNQQEAEVIKQRYPPEKLKIINHFVEVRDSKFTPNEARKKIGLQDFKIITIQGFIFPSKGHKLLIEAIPYLTPNLKVIFAGGPSPNNEQFLESLLQQAKNLGVAERLIITGYLSETDLEYYLMATHLAICPFRNMSSSGSLCTWISVGKPILASNLPQIRDYNQLVPESIHIFDPDEAVTLANRINELLPQCTDEKVPAVVKLREKLLLPRVVDKYLKLLT
ncbi:MAG: glycosyltransferase [Gloeocapsa sp. DLM2.Bin57]|nr:MAG: glycosyltransferase [Gloeocapsa sp. DLM2.Bin57]